MQQMQKIIAEDDSQLFRQDAGYVYVAKEDGRHVVGVNEASFGGSGDSGLSGLYSQN